MNVMLRHCKDDYHALIAAKVMSQLGLTVFSITAYGAPSTTCPHIVWARYANDTFRHSKGWEQHFVDSVHAAIDEALFPPTPEPVV